MASGICGPLPPPRVQGAATFPPVGDLERDDALARIARRHQKHDDPRWSGAGTEARDVLDYLSRHRDRLPRQVADDDAWDELVLSAWVYWNERRRERELLRHALARGLSLGEVGAFVGLHSRQGLRDHLDSLDARLHEYHHLTREHRLRHPRAGGRDLLAEEPSDSDEVATDGEVSASGTPTLRVVAATPTCGSRAAPAPSGAPTASTSVTGGPPPAPAPHAKPGSTTTASTSPPASAGC